MSATVQVKIIDPNAVLYDGAADYILAPGRDSTLGILPGHTPMFAELVKGDLYIAGQNEQVFSIHSGMLKVRADIVTILVTLEG